MHSVQCRWVEELPFHQFGTSQLNSGWHSLLSAISSNEHRHLPACLGGLPCVLSRHAHRAA